MHGVPVSSPENHPLWPNANCSAMPGIPLDSEVQLTGMLCIWVDMAEGNVTNKTPGLSSRNGTIVNRVNQSELLSCVSAGTRQR